MTDDEIADLATLRHLAEKYLLTIADDDEADALNALLDRAEEE